MTAIQFNTATAVYYGNTQILKVMVNDAEVWPLNSFVGITTGYVPPNDPAAIPIPIQQLTVYVNGRLLMQNPAIPTNYTGRKYALFFVRDQTARPPLLESIAHDDPSGNTWTAQTPSDLHGARVHLDGDPKNTIYASLIEPTSGYSLPFNNTWEPGWYLLLVSDAAGAWHSAEQYWCAWLRLAAGNEVAIPSDTVPTPADLATATPQTVTVVAGTTPLLTDAVPSTGPWAGTRAMLLSETAGGLYGALPAGFPGATVQMLGATNALALPVDLSKANSIDTAGWPAGNYVLLASSTVVTLTSPVLAKVVVVDPTGIPAVQPPIQPPVQPPITPPATGGGTGSTTPVHITGTTHTVPAITTPPTQPTGHEVTLRAGDGIQIPPPADPAQWAGYQGVVVKLNPDGTYTGLSRGLPQEHQLTLNGTKTQGWLVDVAHGETIDTGHWPWGTYALIASKDGSFSNTNPLLLKVTVSAV